MKTVSSRNGPLAMAAVLVAASVCLCFMGAAVGSQDQPTQTSSLFPLAPVTFFIQANGSKVAQASDNTNNLFGGIVVFDNPVTQTADPTSTYIGRARGLWPYDSNIDTIPGFEVVQTVVFNGAGGYTANSSLIYRGAQRGVPQNSELSIIGGTGQFRMARGWVIVNTVSETFGDGTASAVLNYTNTVFLGP